MLRLCIRSTVRNFVNALPDGLDKTYERILKGIPKTNQHHVQRVLQCLAMAFRPLRVHELAQILTFNPDGIEGEDAMLDVNSPLEDQEQELLSACPSLITVVDSLGSRVVQFSHFSVKEFLMSGRLSASGEGISRYHILPEVAHTTIAQTSLGVLLRLDDRVDRWKARNTLAPYAAEHWVSHVLVANTSSRVMRMMETLFDPDKPHFTVWIRLYDMDGSGYWVIAAPLYYAALCGFYTLAEHLVKKNPGHVNTLGGRHDYPLVAALCNGHIQVANLLVQHGANLDGQGKNGRTPLHHVIITWLGKSRKTVVGPDLNSQQSNFTSHDRHHEAVRVLLDHGANVNAEDEWGRSPLQIVLKHSSINDDSLSLVQLLAKHDADVNKQDGNRITPLHVAAYRQHLELVRVLLDNGASVDAKNIWGSTPLYELLYYHNTSDNVVRIVQLLVERGANVNTPNKGLWTPLHLASQRQCLELVRVLFDLGASVNVEADSGWTPLHFALAGPNISKNGISVVQDGVGVVRLLLERGANVNAPNKYHVTPLHIASMNQNLELVRMLLNHDANINVNAKDRHYRTPLHRALEGSVDCFGVVQQLVEHGAKVNTKDEDLITPLHFASYCQKLESVRVLLDHGADVNAKDSHHRTPLHRVLERTPMSEDGFGVVQLLVKHGADVKQQDMDYLTPLHFASFNQHLESVRVLLNHGADVNAQDRECSTPLHHVLCDSLISEDGFKVIQLLLKHGTDVNTREKNPPLHFASYNQHLELVRELLDNGADVNAEDSEGRTALHKVFANPDASDRDVLVLVQLLLDRGADVNTQDDLHQTPLHLALRSGRFEGPWVLLKHGADLNVENKEGKIPFQLAQELIKEEMRGASPGSFNRVVRAERVVLMSLLYAY